MDFDNPVIMTDAALEPLEADDFGPKMALLTERQRAFVRLVIEYPTASKWRVAKLAGFSGIVATLKVTAHRLMHSDKVIDALEEETRKRLKYGGFVGVARLVKMASEPNHPQHFKACEALADRAGFVAVQKVEVKDTTEPSAAAMVSQIRALCAELGVDPGKLLGANAVPALTAPVDAEFEEVRDGR